MCDPSGIPVHLAGGLEHAGMSSFPCLARSSTSGGEARFALGDPLVDWYLAFVAGSGEHAAGGRA